MTWILGQAQNDGLQQLIINDWILSQAQNDNLIVNT
jgi:hypothetical protein